MGEVNSVIVEAVREKDPIGAVRFLFDRAPVRDSGCVARCRGSPEQCVFVPCNAEREDPGLDYCAAHRSKKNRYLGIWDPKGGHFNLLECHRRAGWAEACKRAKLAERVDASEIAGGERQACSLQGNAAGRLRQQRKYLSVDKHEKSQLRRLDEEPVALPPYPCMLCEKAFATVCDFENHVA